MINTSSLSHLIATLLSIAALAVFVVRAAIYATAIHVVSFVIFGLALIGIFLKIFRVRIPRWLPTFMYLLMGWLIVVAFVPLRALIPATGIFWLATGGVLYTIGTLFFALSSHKNYQPKHRWFTFHDAFHVLAMGGSIS